MGEDKAPRFARPSDKDKTTSSVEFTPDVYAIIQDTMRERDLGFGAGCPGATLHVLRHTLNTHLRGLVPDVKLQAAFGWSGAEIQNVYSHAELYDVSEQSRAIDALIGGTVEND